MAGVILWINKKGNVWDILFFNSTLAIVTLFIVGLYVNDIIVWRIVVGSLGTIATGEIIIRHLIKK